MSFLRVGAATRHGYTECRKQHRSGKKALPVSMCGSSIFYFLRVIEFRVLEVFVYAWG